MSAQWLLFACLTVVGSLGYNIAMKIGATNINAFVFAFILSLTALCVQAVVCGVSWYGFKIDLLQNISSRGILCAVAAGCAAALIDISYYFSVRYGSAVAAQTFWTFGGIIVLTIVSALFLHETLTISKAAGIVLGLAGLFLIIH